MDSDKDFLKSSLCRDAIDTDSSFITSSHVKSDINLGSLGEVNDSMTVTVDGSGIMDSHLKDDGIGASTTLMSSTIPDNLILIDTAKGLVLSMPEGSSDGLSFGGHNIATTVDENGRPTGILTSSLQGSMFSQLHNVGGIEESQVQVYDGVNGNHVVRLGTILTDSDQTEDQNLVPAPEELHSYTKRKRGGGWPKGKRRKPRPEIEPPKKPNTGYVIFALERRKEIKASNPELQFPVITKILGQEWSNMPKDQKEMFFRTAEEDKEPYIREMEEYQRSGMFSRKADEDKERYIREMEEFQNSEVYQAFVKSKKMAGEHLQGITDSNDALIDLEDEDGLSGLYCKVCNQYFLSKHNKKEHMFGRQHLQNITSEIQKDIEKQAALQKQEMLLAAGLDGTVQIQTDGLHDLESVMYARPVSRWSESLDLFGFVKEFMDKNSEREHEIHLLRRSKQTLEKENEEITKQFKELEEMHSMLEQDLGNLKAYEASMTAQVNSLRMVSTLYGVINF